MTSFTHNRGTNPVTIKFAVFDKVDTVECETQTEKDLAKLRWTKSKQVRPDDKEDESDQTEEGR